MKDQIFTMTENGQLRALTAQAFAKEDDLQALIAKHPELLAWEQMRPGGSMGWILIKREMGIAKDAGAGDRWAVDHLFIDQDAVPTLVEVKRGANREVRRDIVGQMLEYAAHAWQTWTAGDLRKIYEGGPSADEKDDELRDLLGVDDEDDESWRDNFWQKVGDNLATKRLRLLFVADDIPDELTRIVEFLNATMRSVEVLAVEVKKFDGVGLRTLVPRVIGTTAKPADAKSQLDRHSFLEKFEDKAVRKAVERFLALADDNGSFVYIDRGARIRHPTRPGGRKWKTVAWIYPPGKRYGELKDFTFQILQLEDDDPPELRKLLQDWASQFKDIGFGHGVSVPRGGAGWQVTAAEAAQHIDPLAGRLESFLSDLRSLGAR